MYAGLFMNRLCRFALEKGLTGLEFAFGIPGSAGGAAFMNAGAYGGEMKDVLTGCTHLTQSGERGRLVGEELALGYRRSAYRENGFLITSLLLRLAPGDKTEIQARMEDLIARRKAKQPLEYPRLLFLKYHRQPERIRRNHMDHFELVSEYELRRGNRGRNRSGSYEDAEGSICRSEENAFRAS